jgi:Sap, sulfolipid-1-addressing protein
MGHVLLFSFTAMANPTLLAATTVMLLLPNPQKLMLGYLVGALMTSITLGLLIVFTLSDSGAVGTAQRTVNPAADLAIGALLLVIAAVLSSGRPHRREPGPEAADKAPPRWQRAIGSGSPRTTFVVGALLTLPGASYLAALTGIVRLDPGTAQAVALVVMVNVIMLALLEVPLIGFAVAPDRTLRTVQRARDWLRRNGRRTAVTGAALLGGLLILRGLITLRG